jgi:RHS repeat-associated protein
MSMAGSTMTLWYKPVGGAWSSLATATDSIITGAGYLYLDVYGSAGRIDDFGGGTRPISLAPNQPAMAWVAGSLPNRSISLSVNTQWLTDMINGLKSVWQAFWSVVHAHYLVSRPAVGNALVPPAGQVWRIYIRVGNQRIALHEYTAGGEKIYYLLTDHLGSTVGMTDGEGRDLGKVGYKPWGETRYTVGTVATNRRFTGQVDYPGLGLYFYGARWYDPYITQFTQPDQIIPDPYNSLDWNRYAYVRSNPVNRVDPDGHRSCTDVDENGKCASFEPFPNYEKLTPEGLQMYLHYVDFNNQPGWWNNNKPCSMTPQTFIGLWTLWERGGNAGVKVWLVEAVKNGLWMNDPRSLSREAFCKTQNCNLGLFNYMAAQGGIGPGSVNDTRYEGDQEPQLVELDYEKTLGDLMENARRAGQYITSYDPNQG